MFKLEPIVNKNLTVWGYEALLSLNIPNTYIFAIPNPVLELYLLDTFLQSHTDLINSTKVTFNLSIFALIIGTITLKKFLNQHKNLYVEITENAFVPSGAKNEWMTALKELLEEFPGRFILDDYMEGKTTTLLNYFSDLFFAVKVSTSVLKRIKTHKLNGTIVIAEKVENEEDFNAVKEKAHMFQGFYFKTFLKSNFSEKPSK